MSERIKLNFKVEEGEAINKLIVSSQESFQTSLKNILLVPDHNIGLSMMVSDVCLENGFEFGNASFSLGEKCFFLEGIGPVRAEGNVDMNNVTFEVMSMDALKQLNECIGQSFLGVMLNDEEEEEFNI